MDENSLKYLQDTSFTQLLLTSTVDVMQHLIDLPQSSSNRIWNYTRNNRVIYAKLKLLASCALSDSSHKSRDKPSPRPTLSNAYEPPLNWKLISRPSGHSCSDRWRVFVASWRDVKRHVTCAVSLCARQNVRTGITWHVRLRCWLIYMCPFSIC